MTVSHHDPRVLATLLLALHDRLNTIRAPRWQREDTRGLTRQHWIVCPKCLGDGKIPWKHRQVTCDNPHCKGAGGWRGDPMIAAKYQRAVTENDDHAASVLAFTGRILDMGVPELDRLDHAIDVTLGLDDDLEQDARTAARHDHPSTLQIWDALSIMLRDFPHHGGILYRVFVWAWTPERHLGETDRELVDDALHILAETLRARSPQFRAPGWALRAVEADRMPVARGRWANGTQIAQRDEKIREMAANGMGVRAISRKLAVNASTISRVLNRKEAA